MAQESDVVGLNPVDKLDQSLSTPRPLTEKWVTKNFHTCNSAILVEMLIF